MEQMQKYRKTAKLFMCGCLALMLSITTITALCNVDKSTRAVMGATAGNFQIATGSSHTLAIINGELYAWGYNYFGQLGLDDKIDRYVPTRVGTASNWSSVTAGYDHSLAINTDGELYAWGHNYHSQLGLDDVTNRTVPTRVGTANNWSTVTSGDYHALAINISGELYAWGHNRYGELGLGNANPVSPYIGAAKPTRVGEATNWKFISAGDYHTLAINTAGELHGWGKNDIGQLGLGNENNQNLPTRVDAANNWSMVAAGSSSTYAINAAGELYSWGLNVGGKLGLGDTTPRNTPTRVGDKSNWSIVTAGLYHAFSINTSGELYSWGTNNYGQLGLGDTTQRNVPTRVGTANNWEAVSSGDWHTIATNTTGEHYTWGAWSSGQLGLGDAINRHEPTEVVIIGANIIAPNNITGITFSNPSAKRVKFGGSYTFTATLSNGFTSPIIQLTAPGKTIAKIALTSMNKNVYIYKVYDIQSDITATHFTVSVSRIT